MIRGSAARHRVANNAARHWPTIQRLTPRRPLPMPTRTGLIWMDLGDSVESLRRLLWVYEPMKFRNIARFLPQGGGFVDVGANLGDFSIWAAKQGGPATRVLAVEADPDNVPQLRRNLRLHKLDDVVELAPVAAAAETGTIELHQGHQSGTSTIAPSEVHALEHMKPRGTVSIPARTLDDLVDSSALERVDVVKIDVEGAEEYVLAGARNLLATSHPMTFLIDIHWGVNVAGIVADLADHGFTTRLEAEPDVVVETVPREALSIVCIRS
ncbi:MAG TPA: FkbM family methyltransferase [Mycobacteriales bacterium]|nr:FkbM family methyltransferase [Mycobacteriales bacterium]